MRLLVPFLIFLFLGFVKSSSAAGSPATINNATAKLNGVQEGEYKVEVKTGMMISCHVSSVVKGSAQALGQELPVEIKTTIKMIGIRIK